MFSFLKGEGSRIRFSGRSADDGEKHVLRLVKLQKGS